MLILSDYSKMFDTFVNNGWKFNLPFRNLPVSESIAGIENSITNFEDSDKDFSRSACKIQIGNITFNNAKLKDKNCFVSEKRQRK